MVSWNSPERGIRLSDGHQPLGYFLSCLACGRGVRVRFAEAVRIWGADAYARDVAQSLKCSRCGESKGHLQVIDDTRPVGGRDPDDYWGPSPDWPELKSPPP